MIDDLKPQLDLAVALHNVAVKERDLARLSLARSVEEREALRVEVEELRAAISSLHSRVRPDCEAAPWVVAELHRLSEGHKKTP